MSNYKTTPEFMLLFKGVDWDEDLSPEELQAIMSKFMRWVNDLTAQGTIKAAQPLEMTGRVLTAQHGRAISDGPFIESKEAVGGYFILDVPTMEAAMEIARAHPLLEYGLTVEVRPIADMCPSMHKVSGDLSEFLVR